MPGSGTTTPVQLDDGFIQDPYSLYRALREEGPVREAITPTGLKVWLVTRFAEAREALADPRLSRNMRAAMDLFRRHSNRKDEVVEIGAELAEHMLNSDPPDHTRLRRLVTRVFTARRVELMRPQVERITEDLLAGLAGADRVDLVDTFAWPLPVTVICELLGVPTDDRDDFRRWTNAMLAGTDREAAIRAAMETAGYLTRLIADKRDNPADDLLTALIQEPGDALTENELVSMAFLLLVAGHETTVNLIANGVLVLLRNPDQLAALRADPGLLPGAVEEFLRYESPINQATIRRTTEPIRLGDVEIPADEFVVVAINSANRDEGRFAGAEQLDVTRDATGHLAFGHGIHYCLGAPLARMEGQIAIGRLLDRFPDIALDAGPDELHWRESMLLHGLVSLPVRLR